MKCNNCPFIPSPGPDGDCCECEFFEARGTVWKDGQEGCRFTSRQIEKMQNEYADYMGAMGDDMGIEMDFKNKGWKMDSLLSDMRHMIGLDMLKHKPYKRHGKMFYKPYRNFWAGQNKYLDYLSGVIGLVEKTEEPDKMPYYYLTRRGLNFFGRHIGVTIHDVEK